MDVSFFEESPRLKFNQVLRQVQSIHTVTEELVNELQTTVEEGKFTVDRFKVRPPEWHDWAKANHPQQYHHQPLRGPRNRHRRINLQTPPHAPSQQEERRDRDRHPGGTVPRQSEVSCNSTSGADDIKSFDMEQINQAIIRRYQRNKNLLVGDFTVGVYFCYADADVVQVYKGDLLLPSSSSSSGSGSGSKDGKSVTTSVSTGIPYGRLMPSLQRKRKYAFPSSCE